MKKRTRRPIKRAFQDAIEQQAQTIATLVHGRLGRELPFPSGFVLALFNTDGPEFTFIGDVDPEKMELFIDGLIAKYKQGFWTRGVGARLDGPSRTALPAPGPLRIEQK
jgi:hypothetical protein